MSPRALEMLSLKDTDLFLGLGPIAVIVNTEQRIPPGAWGHAFMKPFADVFTPILLDNAELIEASLPDAAGRASKLVVFQAEEDHAYLLILSLEELFAHFEGGLFPEDQQSLSSLAQLGSQHFCTLAYVSDDITFAMWIRFLTRDSAIQTELSRAHSDQETLWS